MSGKQALLEAGLFTAGIVAPQVLPFGVFLRPGARLAGRGVSRLISAGGRGSVKLPQTRGIGGVLGRGRQLQGPSARRGPSGLGRPGAAGRRAGEQPLDVARRVIGPPSRPPGGGILRRGKRAAARVQTKFENAMLTLGQRRVGQPLDVARRLPSGRKAKVAVGVGGGLAGAGAISQLVGDGEDVPEGRGGIVTPGESAALLRTQFQSDVNADPEKQAVWNDIKTAVSRGGDPNEAIALWEDQVGDATGLRAMLEDFQASAGRLTGETSSVAADLGITLSPETEAALDQFLAGEGTIEDADEVITRGLHEAIIGALRSGDEDALASIATYYAPILNVLLGLSEKKLAEAQLGLSEEEIQQQRDIALAGFAVQREEGLKEREFLRQQQEAEEEFLRGEREAEEEFLAEERRAKEKFTTEEREAAEEFAAAQAEKDREIRNYELELEDRALRHQQMVDTAMLQMKQLNAFIDMMANPELLGTLLAQGIDPKTLIPNIEGMDALGGVAGVDFTGFLSGFETVPSEQPTGGDLSSIGRLRMPTLAELQQMSPYQQSLLVSVLAAQGKVPRSEIVRRIAEITPRGSGASGVAFSPVAQRRGG